MKWLPAMPTLPARPISSSPSAYGAFGIVLDGQLLSYHYLLPKDLAKLIGKSA